MDSYGSTVSGVLASRLTAFCVLLRTLYLAFVAIVDVCLRDYDTSVHLLNTSCWRYDVAGSFPALGREDALQSIAVWDCVFFVHIARCGYEYEQFYAFFPLLPGAMQVLDTYVLQYVLPFNEVSRSVAAGLILSLVAFVIAAHYLQRLSFVVLQDGNLAVLSVLLYCFSPASIFMSAAYTESLYSAATFAGLYYLQAHGNISAASLLLAVATASRSNGVTSCGFLLYYALRQMMSRGHWSHKLGVLARSVCGCVLVAMPMVLFQIHGYRVFCQGHTPRQPWCERSLPLIYNWVQEKYWGVGLLKYYTWSQAPNFLLASPVLLFTACGWWCYMSHDWIRGLTAALLSAHTPPRMTEKGEGTKPFELDAPGKTGSTSDTFLFSRLRHRQRGAGGSNARTAAGSDDRPDSRSSSGNNHPDGNGTGPDGGVRMYGVQGSITKRGGSGYFGDVVCVYVWHWAALSLIALLVMNVQVATRFLSSCPAVYWYAAHVCSRESSNGGFSHWKYILWGYCLMYMVLGALLFPNFYPWT